MPVQRDALSVHARCFEAGERVIGVAAAILAEQRAVLFCAGCLATELGIGQMESQSALWHVARAMQVRRGTCGCDQGGGSREASRRAECSCPCRHHTAHAADPRPAAPRTAAARVRTVALPSVPEARLFRGPDTHDRYSKRFKGGNDQTGRPAIVVVDEHRDVTKTLSVRVRRVYSVIVHVRSAMSGDKVMYGWCVGADAPLPGHARQGAERQCASGKADLRANS
ncbi:MAG: hypothetical protein ACRDHF_04355 [Tepidiformaceae bacterium]